MGRWIRSGWSKPSGNIRSVKIRSAKPNWILPLTVTLQIDCVQFDNLVLLGKAVIDGEPVVGDRLRSLLLDIVKRGRIMVHRVGSTDERAADIELAAYVRHT